MPSESEIHWKPKEQMNKKIIQIVIAILLRKEEWHIKRFGSNGDPILAEAYGNRAFELQKYITEK